MNKFYLVLATLLTTAPLFPQNFSSDFHKSFGSTGWETIAATIIDAQGNAYVYGSFSGTIELAAAHQVTSNGKRDVFLAKIDKDGTTQWLKNYGGNYDENAYSLVENNGNIYLAGSFKKEMAFASYTSLQAASFTELFFIKVNAVNGEINQQPIAIQGTSAAQQAYLQKKSNGEIVMAGAFTKDLTINGNQLTANGKTDIFYATYDETLNNFKNEVRFGGTDEDQLNGFLISPADELYFVGGFKTDFTSGLSTLEATNKKSDGFFIKIDNAGATALARKIGGDYNDQLKKLAVDIDGNIYIAGEYEHHIVVDGTPFTTTKKHDSFLFQLDASGNHGWETQLGNNAYTTISSLALAGDKIYITGTFRGTLEDEISTRNSKDAYIALYQKETGAQHWLEKAGHNHEDNLNIKRYPDGKILVSGFFSNAFELKGEDGFTAVAISDKNYKDLYVAKLIDCSTLPAPDLGENQTACASHQITVPEGYLGYSWNGGAFSDVRTYTATETGTVRLTVVDDNNCELSNEVTITINEGTTIDLGPATTICEGSDLVLDAGSGYNSYLWDDGSTMQTRTVDAAGTYTVQANNAATCGSGSVEVIVNPLPVFELGGPVYLPEGVDLFLDPGLVGSYTYLWNNGDTTSTLSLPRSMFSRAVYVGLTVSDQAGCSYYDEVLVQQGDPPAGIASNQEGTDITTSSEQNKEDVLESYKVYPNPSTGKFYLSVSGPEKVKQVDVFDIRGNKVKTYQDGFGFPLEIDLAGQAKGAYLIKVSEAEMAKEFRIILK